MNDMVTVWRSSGGVNVRTRNRGNRGLSCSLYSRFRSQLRRNNAYLVILLCIFAWTEDDPTDQIKWCAAAALNQCVQNVLCQHIPRPIHVGNVQGRRREHHFDHYQRQDRASWKTNNSNLTNGLALATQGCRPLQKFFLVGRVPRSICSCFSPSLLFILLIPPLTHIHSPLPLYASSYLRSTPFSCTVVVCSSNARVLKIFSTFG